MGKKSGKMEEIDKDPGEIYSEKHQISPGVVIHKVSAGLVVFTYVHLRMTITMIVMMMMMMLLMTMMHDRPN